jgi:hypothetical protein
MPIHDAVPLPDASTLAEFAHKYQVDALQKTIMQYLTENVELDPVGVYVIAVAYGYKSIGAKAARSCLNVPFSRLQSPCLQYATAEHHAELLNYHVACGDAASAVASGRTWFPSFGDQLGNSQLFTTGHHNIGGNGCPSCITQDSIDGTSISSGAYMK